MVSLKKDTLYKLNRFLNVIILVLVIVVFYYMFMLLKKEYFTNNTTNTTNTINTRLAVPSTVAQVLNTTNPITNVALNPITNVALNPITIPRYNQIGSKETQILNFMAYPNEQKFCPNIPNSITAFWCKFPETYGGGYLGKFCCSSCYYIVCEEIYCGENQNGNYILDNLNLDDIANLESYYETIHIKNNGKLEYSFPIMILNNQLGNACLKMKLNDIYYPIQLLKNSLELETHDVNPTISESLYVDSYTCKNVNVNNTNNTINTKKVGDVDNTAYKQ